MYQTTHAVKHRGGGRRVGAVVVQARESALWVGTRRDRLAIFWTRARIPPSRKKNAPLNLIAWNLTICPEPFGGSSSEPLIRFHA